MSPLPISLDLVKGHCSILSSDTDFDDLLTSYLQAGIEWAEGYMHRTIFARSHVWVLKEFPVGKREQIRLPRGKTVSVESIEYRTNKTTYTLRGSSSGSPAGADYQEDIRGDDGAVLMPPVGGCWPSTDCEEVAPVTVNFTAGWQPSEVPSEIIHSILFSVNDALELRGSADLTSPNLNVGPRLHSREALLSGWVLSRWY